jgi:hypothetical protein
VSWVHLNTAFAGTANLNIFGTPFQQDATGRPGGAYTNLQPGRLQRPVPHPAQLPLQISHFQAGSQTPGCDAGAFVWHGQQPYGALCARSVERAAVERNTMKETPHAEQAAVHGNL